MDMATGFENGENIMDFKTTVKVDLSEYGLQGTIEMGMPSYRKVAEMKNLATRYTKLRKDSGDDAYIEGLPQGDLEELTMLMYIKKAPFPCTLEGWYNFTDMLDSIDMAFTLRLATRLKMIALDLESIRGPFVNSLVQENRSSV